MLSIGVFGKSRKKDEQRVAIHPVHLEQIDPALRASMFFESGYGEPFGMEDEALGNIAGGIYSRSELFSKCEIALIAKPALEDFQDMQEGTIHWGWPHCVQQEEITQAAIDRKLTLIAWEEMHNWSSEGSWLNHTFFKNNEIAGYAGVHHAFNLLGIDGNYGEKKKALIISYGSVSQGAVRGLQSRGIEDLHVVTPASYQFNKAKIKGVKYSVFENSGELVISEEDGTKYPFIHAVKNADVIVNGILQDTDHPLTFVREFEVPLLKRGSLIVDISCDEGMGFSFAKPTSYQNPMFALGKAFYYAVDHTPSYIWNAASWEISRALLPFIPVVMGGEKEWQQYSTIQKAIEIKEGIIQNPKILTFQNRESKYPHVPKD